MRLTYYASCVCALALLVGACGGGSPTTPRPAPTPTPTPNAPANALPSVDGIIVQGRRNRQPARFADLRETVDVRAAVTDAETPITELTYQWSATAGAFSGSGSAVTWTAPDSATTPGTVTITLKVTEHYGHPGQPKNFSHEVTRTQTLALHDSAKEIAGMSFRFLDEFSKPQSNQDWQNIMRDFKASACPQPGLVDDEKADVIDHYSTYDMLTYSIQTPAVSVHFGEGCSFRARPGDACAVVGVSWRSRERSKPSPDDPTSGLDHIAAVYSTADARWWLCSSDYQPTTSLRAGSFYAR